MNEQNNELKLPTKASKKDRIVFFALVLFSILILIAGYFKIKNTIYQPFATKINPSVEKLENILKSNQDKDTDGDGIQDWQEENTYHTSKYLTDSDGDGINDKEEILVGSNPLDSASTPSNVGSYQADTSANQPLSVDNLITPESEQSTENLTTDQIREILITQGGMSKDVVDKIDDETIKKMYNETKQETGIDLESVLKNSPTSPNLEGQSEANSGINQDTSLLNVSEIRALLLQNGVDKNMLDTIDDETLKNMFLQSISNPIGN